ncbi:hypothetical protein JW887_04175 [Candidatus Dojkabacteria bacterium]|nr:hypothetical protein [Candidatus Dojkabacteria bacterium]
MSSIIQGYNYDIFISYRQKDNKHDGWVSEFVNNLKGELESTFKKDISVYFDINPHDGLLQTHDVDESLKEKLKCLIFIPIISRTYCDPDAFAWEHEFKAFVEQTLKDEFGLKVRLPNGNVASRVLPVQIHELDNEDIDQCESVLGSVLRGIEFIYKEAGVNRPLKPDDDAKENLNKTNYRNQINKVANAIKEIISAIQHYNPQQDKTALDISKQVSTPQKNKKTPIIIISIVTIALIILGLLFIPKLLKPEEEIEKSIAVLPFEVWNSDDEYAHMGDAIANEINTQLAKIKEFHVFSYTSTSQYKGSDKSSIPQIAKELGANFIIEGTFERQSDNVSIHVRIIRAESDDQLSAEEFKGNWQDIFTIRAEIAAKIADELKAKLSSEEIKKIKEIPTRNLDAYAFYLLGKDRLANHFKDEDIWKAIEYFQQSVILDPTYALAYTGLADAYYQLVNYAIESPNIALPRAQEYSFKALELNANLTESHCMLGLIKEIFEYDFDGAEKEYCQALEIDPENYNAYYYYSRFLSMMGRHNEAIEQAEFCLKLEPMSFEAKINAYLSRYYAGSKSEAMKLMENLRDSYPDNPYGYWFCAVIYTDLGMYNEALLMLQTQINLMGSDNISDETGLQGYLYGKLGQEDKALKQLDKLDSLALEGYYIAPRTHVWVYLGINNVDRAIEILESSFSDHTFDPRYLQIFPTSLVEEDERFIEIRKNVGMLH